MRTENTNTAMSWDHPDVKRYEKTISLKIPGYFHLYEMTDHLIAAQLQGENSSCDVLVVGAGGGQEIVTLGGRHEAWTFTGIDPSAHMLEIAKSRAETIGLGERVSLIQGRLEQLSLEDQYDAATCLLVLHFVKGLQQKQELLQRIGERLKPGAPFCFASFHADTNTDTFHIQMQAWKSHMLENGIPQEDWERFEASIGLQSDPIPSSVVQELLEQSGFTHATRYFGSYFIDGWFAIKA
ncbi:class I SAM-dependent methyltransferase [Brevibacillus halotolerans]|uniref:class I SAM-dependent methyltransferase n=1 Tax=Brevibacillus laterosporus TaxID=1465 RepID=UPI00215BECB0|nr:class I SAM-dependent methyltransferase [Brevibacillus laterosporus]MCR8996297.1 class I SAM-dependent methyltransferase [Brevibacillus laterosporus]WPS88105.1 class I SAM-dependent methyltransferase [Brevibacillus halotolerans]